MEVYEAINSRRSVRKYTDEAVPREVLQRIVQTGIEAPSGCNYQLRQYIIVDDPATMDAMRPFSNALPTAQAAIVILMDPQATPYGEFWVQDASAAIENMLLAIVDEGYGACWIEGAIRSKEQDLREILSVPEDLRVWAILSVGKPAETPERPKKPSYDEIVYVNRYGQKS